MTMFEQYIAMRKAEKINKAPKLTMGFEEIYQLRNDIRELDRRLSLPIIQNPRHDEEYILYNQLVKELDNIFDILFENDMFDEFEIYESIRDGE